MCGVVAFAGAVKGVLQELLLQFDRGWWRSVTLCATERRGSATNARGGGAMKNGDVAALLTEEWLEVCVWGGGGRVAFCVDDIKLGRRLVVTTDKGVGWLVAVD
jgi:hypothetical protein